MTETDDGDFTIKITAYGILPVCFKRPMCLWDKTYNRKIREGYVDRSKYCSIFETNNHAPIKDPDVAALWEELHPYSHEAIRENYEIKISEVSEKMLPDTESLLNQLSEDMIEISEFNRILSQIFVIMPGRMKDGCSMIASSSMDIPVIVERENELFDLVKAQVMDENSESENGRTILESLGLEIQYYTSSEETQIRKHPHPETMPFFSIFIPLFQIHTIY